MIHTGPGCSVLHDGGSQKGKPQAETNPTHGLAIRDLAQQEGLKNMVAALPIPHVVGITRDERWNVPLPVYPLLILLLVFLLISSVCRW